MDVGIYYSGEFGRRFVLNLAFPEMCPHLGACGIDYCDRCKKYDFSSKIVEVREFQEPSTMGVYIDDVNIFLPDKTEMDVLIAINIHPDILIELSEFSDIRALIVPVEDPKWCTPGLRKQLERSCIEVGIEFQAPKPLCTLKRDSRIIRKLCTELNLGMPEFRIKLEDDTIRRVEALSDTCGCAYYVARKMRGYRIENYRDFWKDIHQHQCSYPCMASMERDLEIVEAPFHLAGYVMVYRFSSAAGIDAESFIPKHMKRFILPNSQD